MTNLSVNKKFPVLITITKVVEIVSFSLAALAFMTISMIAIIW